MFSALICAALAAPVPSVADAPAAPVATDTEETIRPDWGLDVLAPIGDDSADTYVVGGAPSAPGSWQSTVAVIYGNMAGCTGTLVAPDVVVTAAHCVTPEEPTQVRTGSVDATQGGQLIAVDSVAYHPSYDGWSGVDIAVIHLQSPSSSPTTTIAADCVGSHLYDGGPVMIVGFGSTNPQGTTYPDELYEAASTIRDADCSENVLGGQQTTCEAALRPAGELAAGGNGVDSCYGDSGGPLYVQGSDGDWYLAGVTSRGFATQNCGSGGVYVRPDTYMSWLESEVGTLPRPVCSGPGPSDQDEDLPPPPPVDDGDPTLDPGDDPGIGKLEITSTELWLVKNTAGAIALEATGLTGNATWEILEGPAVGSASIRDDALFYSPIKGWTGSDIVVVTVTDASGAVATGEIAVNVTHSGGCDNVGGRAPMGLFLLGLAALVGRRSR